MIDRVTAKLGRKLYEVPVGFKWFVDGLLDGSLGFGGEESAGASFARLDGTVWTTDKDGIVPALLAAEITARMGRDPGEIYHELTREFGEPVYDRVEAPATPEQKELLAKLSPQQVKLTELAGEKIQTVLTHAPGNGAPIGGLKVAAESGWFAARPSGTEDIYKIYAESFRGADHLRRILEEAQTIVNDALRAMPPERGGKSRNEEQAMHSEIRPEKFGRCHEKGKTPRSLAPRPSSFGSQRVRFSGGACPDMRWSWNHATDGVWRRSIRCCGNSRKTLGWSCRRFRATNLSACWPIPLSVRASTTICRPSARSGGARMVSEKHPQGAPDLRRIFQHGIYVERSAPDLFGRTRQCRRRSAQSRGRSGRAGGRGGAALPTRLFSPSD